MVQISATKAPGQLQNADEAFRAFGMLVRYRGLEFDSYTHFMASDPDTPKAIMHYRNYEKYARAADSWEDVIETWLKRAAQWT